MRPASTQPTDVELAILRALWTLGQGTVRQVQEILGQEASGYTSVLKMLLVMHEKGLVTRETEGKAHVYRPAEAQRTTQRSMLKSFVTRAFGGRTTDLVAMALEQERLSREDRAAIETLLEKARARRKP